MSMDAKDRPEQRRSTAHQHGAPSTGVELARPSQTSRGPISLLYTEPKRARRGTTATTVFGAASSMCWPSKTYTPPHNPTNARLAEYAQIARHAP
jgi:hypothetical protein